MERRYRNKIADGRKRSKQKMNDHQKRSLKMKAFWKSRKRAR